MILISIIDPLFLSMCKSVTKYSEMIRKVSICCWLFKKIPMSDSSVSTSGLIGDLYSLGEF